MRVRLTTDMQGALRHMQRAVPFDVDGHTTGDVRAHVSGCAVFDVVDDEGAPRGAFALSIEGGTLRCVAAGAEPGADALPAIVAFVEREAPRVHARRVQCETQRRGLVRQLLRRGYRVTGFILAKDIS